MELTIARHCVASDPASGGLSPLQRALIEAPEPVRIADAPTGAGKSYAFQYAMARCNQRILFLVPTRRLAQNLAESLIRSLKQDEKWSDAKADGKVAIWSSDATRQLKEAGVGSVSGYRLRQVNELFPSEEGEMVIAIPESLSYLLLERRLEQGHSDKGILDVLMQFDHVVFDEFHTIDARGFGLAALCAKLVATMDVKAKVSFLSATPVEIRPVLAQMGVPDAAIRILKETIVEDGARALHGDVRLGMSEAPSLAALVNEQQGAIASEVRAGRQAVIIYDSLHDLKCQLPEIRMALDAVGVAALSVLVVNSIDDSGKNALISCGFAAGSGRNPDDFDVLIATSSVEMGVTFRAANLLLMEPGLEPANFLQRYGRAARRDEAGRVWVRVDKARRDRAPWLRELYRWLTEHADQRMTIQELSGILSRTYQLKFSAPLGDEPSFFGTLPNRAAFAAGLYWNALIRHPSMKGHLREQLMGHGPSQAKMVHALLKTVRELEKDPRVGQCAREWCDRFESQAYTLRDIGSRVRVEEGNGRIIQVPALWLRRSTDIPERLGARYDAEGKETYVLQDTLDDHLLDERKRVIPEISVSFPHTGETCFYPLNGDLVDAWCRKLNERAGRHRRAWDQFPSAMAAAEKLVRCTGLVVSDDEALSMDSVYGVC